MFEYNRASATTDLLPAFKWRYVSTNYNPADLTSRGFFPQELIEQELWWKGPPWLTDSPLDWPIRTDIGDPPIDKDLPKTAPVLTMQAIEEPVENKLFSSLHHLIKFRAYACRWLHQVRHKIKSSPSSTNQELYSARLKLIIQHQKLYFESKLQR